MQKVLLAFALVLLWLSTANARDCTPAKIATFDLILDANGDILVPVKLDGVDKTVGLDLSRSDNLIYKDVAEELKLHTLQISRIEGIMGGDRGQNPTAYTKMPSVEIGRSRGVDLRFYVVPERAADNNVATSRDVDPKIAGWLGLTVLGNYDIDVDFSNKRLSLLAAGACDEKHTVYWTSSYAVVPLEIERGGNYTFPAQLNGHDEKFAFHTNLPDGSVNLSEIGNLGLTRDSPGMAFVPKEGRRSRADVYDYTFKTLNIGGISISPFAAKVYDDAFERECAQRRSCVGNEATGTVSLAQIEPLHVLISYKTQRMYLSKPGP